MSNGSDLKRVLGLKDALCVVVGAIIGVGIFITPPRVADITGSPGMALLAWGIGGAMALLGALTFAELGGLFPRTGGQYVVLRHAYGQSVAFVYGFCLLTAIQAGAVAIIGIVCARNLGLAAQGQKPGGETILVLATLMILGLAAANVIGVRWGAAIQNWTVYIKVATLVAVTVVAIFAGAGGEQTAEAAGQAATAGDLSGWLGILFVALSPVLFSFGGWQQGTWLAGEVKNARRDVPRAIVLGVLIVIAVYLLANWAYFALLGFDGVRTSGSPAADAMKQVAGGWGARVVAAAVAISAFGVMNAQLLAGPRYIFAMSQDGRFFKTFAYSHPRFRTPSHAVLLLGATSLLLLLVAGENGLNALLTGVVFVDWVFFALTGAAVIVLRKRLPDAERSVRVPGYPVTPILFVLAALAAIVGSFLDASVRSAAQIGVVWIVVAGCCSVFWLRGRR